MTYLPSRKQDTLQSGTNIKTVNGNSLLGSGNISISGATLADGDYGDITVGGSGTTMTIDNLAVTNAKINDVAWSKVTGEPTTLSGYGISDTKANFDTACSDGDFVFVGDAVLNPGGWTTIVKSTNQDVTNSVTLVDDTDLKFSVVAGGMYMIEMDVVISANNTTGDYQNRFAISSGTFKGKGFMIGPTATGAAQVNEYAANVVATSTTLSLGSPSADLDFPVSVKIIFSFYASANATFSYQFANVAAAAGRTSRTMKGSILKYKKIN